MRVLVIDDSAGVSDLVQKLLSRSGYLVNTATSGIDGLATLKKSPVDLVILDMKMPVMDGIEFLKEKAALPTPLKEIPVVVLTADPSVSVGELASPDVRCVVHKPADFETILEAVQSVPHKRG